MCQKRKEQLLWNQPYFLYYLRDCIILCLITKCGIFLSFSVTHCFANLFLFLRFGTQSRCSIARASTKDFYEKKTDLHCQSRKTPTFFTRAYKPFTDSFAVANCNRLTNFSCACCQVGYQTLEFIAGKLAKLFDFKFGMCAWEHIMCLVKKFDQNI